MKNNIVFFIALSLVNFMYSQKLDINKVEISNIFKNINKEVVEISEADEKGPYVLVELKILNNGSKTISLSPSKSIIKITFNYKNKKYEIINHTHQLQELDNVFLKPGESFSYTIDNLLFFGTALWKDKKYNYISETLITLPTVGVQYNDLKNDLCLTSNRINSIILKDKDLGNVPN